MSLKKIKSIMIVLLAIFVVGCASGPKKEYDYTEFKSANPKAILVLPPINDSVEVLASDAIYASITYPIAESGYYVIPVSLVQETLRQNGILTANDAHNIPLSKLKNIFGADAVLYLTIREYGTSYRVIDSETKVTVDGQLRDIQTGKELWKGSRTVSNASDSSGGLLTSMVSAVVSQIASVVSDESYDVGRTASHHLLSAGYDDNILYGPYSPHYWQDQNQSH